MYIGNDLSRGKSTIYHFDASGSETAITTATRPAVTIAYTVGWVAVYLNGVRLHDTDYTATTGNSITGLAALSSGDVVIIEAAHTFSVSDSVPATGGTFSGNVTHSGTVTNSSTTTATGLITANGGLETDTNSKIIQRGEAFMKTSHNSWVMGG